MDDHTIRVLEFDKVLAKASEYATFAPGREEVLATRPMTGMEAIRRAEGLVTEIKEILVSTGRFPLDELRDVRDTVQRARPEGALLDGEALRDASIFLSSGRHLRDAVTHMEREFPRLREAVSEIRVFPSLEKKIGNAVDDDGLVKDTASPELRTIRKTLQILDDRIRARLEEYLRTPEGEDPLQEKFVTLRDGRHVLPVKAERKTEMPGIIHGRSDTGNTVFIEPLPVVEMGNERRDLAGREAAEVRRILKGLTEEVRAILYDMEHNLRVLSRVDAARAKARFSIAFGMAPVLLVEEGGLILLQARHPLLVFQGAEAVPLELDLPPDNRTLLVSGPNTGGKTVALKTVGLLCLMAQSGLHVPADDRSRFPVFSRILADIGDDQSIEASLSTFSSHMTRIVEILNVAGPGTLVLLDEIGAATDPVEGGALACAVLERVHTSGAHSVATTHLTMLKAFAHAREGMMNAGMEFDEASGRPTYRLVKGAPASSRALATARALGLSEEVLADAEARLGEDRTAMETLLQDLHRDALRARRDREAIEAEREAAEHARVEAEARLEGVAKEKKKALRAAHEEAQELLREYRAEAEKVLERIREIRKAEPRPGAKDRARVEQRRLSELSRRAGFEARRLQPLPPNATQEPLHEGQSVALRTMKGFGTVKRIDERRGRAEVDVGGLTFDVETADLIPIKREELPRRLHSRKREDADSRPPIERELHLLGMRVEAALEATRKYVDDAVMADADEVRIVHGFGTGALQKAISEFLKTHPSVDSFRPGKKGEGGAGATVVKLK